MANFSDAKVKMFVKQVRQELGAGWYLFSPRIQRALLAEKAFDIVRGQEIPVGVDAMDALILAMETEAGLR
jgi:hypothetical protein